MNPNDALYQLLYGSNNNTPYLPPTPPPQPQQPVSSLLSSLLTPQSQSNSVLGSLPIAKPQPVRLVKAQPTQPVKLRIAKPKVFVSFDYENDSKYKFLLSAWNSNSRFRFTFQDKTPQEIQTDAVDRVKAVLTSKVKEATYTLVIVGQYATQRHKDAQLIGCTNWINYEIQQSNLYKRKVLAVRLQPNYLLPEQLSYSRGYLIEGFNQANITNTLALLKQLQ